jgi:hypothetical protein
MKIAKTKVLIGVSILAEELERKAASQRAGA